MVPLVIITLLKRSNTGAIARLASRHVKWKIGLGTVACSVSNGSRISKKPLSYVDTSVAKNATVWRAEYSSIRVSSSVWTSIRRRSAQKRSGFLSMKVISLRCCKKLAGVSATTCNTRMRVLKYSTNRRKNATKCSARRMLPGIASCSKSSGKTGFAINDSASRSSLCCCNPSTSRRYSS